MLLRNLMYTPFRGRQRRHKLTVVSHRRQESFNVAVMGYEDSPAYVQRQIGRLGSSREHTLTTSLAIPKR